MAREPRTRTELDKILRDNGRDGLYKNPEAREVAKWAEKQLRLGNDRKTVPDPRKQ